MTTRYISPTGSGLRDGSSPKNAGTLASLNAFVSAVGAGGQVLLLADKGTYHTSKEVLLTAGGSNGKPVTIRGIDSHGDAMAANIVGTRALHWTPGHAEGSELFRLKTGADNLSFRDLSVANVGNGVFRAGADIHNLSISNVAATNVTRFFEDTVSGTNTTATVTGLKIDHVTVTGYSKGAINLGYDSHGIVITNVVGDSQSQNGGLYVSGVHLGGTVHDVVLSSVTMKNNHGQGASTLYWNGDGFTTESGVHGVRLTDTVASGNTDAGYDLKSRDTVLVRTVAEGNNENYRFWSSSITMTDGVSIAPHHFGGVGATAHVWTADDAVATLDHFTFSDSGAPTTLFNLTQTHSTVHLADTAIPLAYADKIHTYGGSVLEVVGTAGNGTYHVHDRGELIVEAPGHGTDTVVTDLATYSLTANVENLAFDGNGSHTGNGNSLGNTIDGGSGRDSLSGLAGSDQLFGNAGNDILSGGAGNNSLVGGAGNDTLIGGQGADTYLFGRGSGHDIISNHDTDGAPDTLRFGAGIHATDLWLSHHGADLIITVIGSGDSAKLAGWYDSGSNKLSSLVLADGHHLGASAVQQEVAAMASVGAVPTDLSHLTHEQHAEVVSVIAASWH